MFSLIQIEELLKIIKYQNIKFIAENIGLTPLLPEDKILLEEFGDGLSELDKTYTLFDESYHFGILSESLGDERTKGLSYNDFKKFLYSESYIPLTDEEEFVLDSIKKQSYSYIKSLADKESKDLYQLISEEEHKLRNEDKLKEELIRGVEQRKSVKSISLDLRKRFEGYRVDFDRIAETEMNNAFQSGRAQNLKRKYGKDVLVYKNVFPGACRHCIRLYLTDGIGSQPKLFKLSELMSNGTNIGKKTNDWKAVIGSVHPYCFNSKSTKILTSKGFKNISNIKVGDLVLTHKNRFRKVTNVIVTGVNDREDVNILNISYKVKDYFGIYRKRKIKRITGNHPILTKDGWVESDKLKIGDIIFTKSVKCELCDNYITINHTIDNIKGECPSCLRRKSAIEQWSRFGMREKISKAISIGNRVRMSKMTKEEKQELTKNARKEVFEKYPNGRPWMEYVLKKSNSTNGKNKTFIERKLQYFLEQIGVKFEIGKFIKNDGEFINNVKGYFPDIYIPELNIVLEADGENWHKDIQYDKNRDLDIKNSIGADTFRFNGNDILNNGDNVYNEIKSILKNHSGMFNSEEVEIVEIIKVGKNNYDNYLYNFSVEEDESYVADGIIVHNCRCTLDYYNPRYEWNEDTKRFDKLKKSSKTIERKSKVKVTMGGKTFEG